MSYEVWVKRVSSRGNVRADGTRSPRWLPTDRVQVEEEPERPEGRVHLAKGGRPSLTAQCTLEALANEPRGGRTDRSAGQVTDVETRAFPARIDDFLGHIDADTESQSAPFTQPHPSTNGVGKGSRPGMFERRAVQSCGDGALLG